jgi:hypothetical protein
MCRWAEVPMCIFHKCFKESVLPKRTGIPIAIGTIGRFVSKGIAFPFQECQLILHGYIFHIRIPIAIGTHPHIGIPIAIGTHRHIGTSAHPHIRTSAHPHNLLRLDGIRFRQLPFVAVFQYHEEHRGCTKFIEISPCTS